MSIIGDEKDVYICGKEIAILGAGKEEYKLFVRLRKMGLLFHI